MANPRHYLPFVFSLLIILLPQALCDGVAQCFYLDTTSAPNLSPCIPASARNSSTHSSCCNINVAVPGDICTVDGLCYSQSSQDSAIPFWQNGCTDSTGLDATCHSPCSSKNGTVNYIMKPCSNGKYCCWGNKDGVLDSEDCCSNGDVTYFVNMTLAQQAESSSATASATATVSSCSTTPSSCPKDNTAAVGASVGAVLGTLLLASLAMAFFFFRKLKRERKQHNQRVMHLTNQVWGHEMKAPPAPPQELSAEHRPHEVS